MLDGRCARGHHYSSRYLELSCRVGYALSVISYLALVEGREIEFPQITGRAGNDPFPALIRVEMCHFIVRSSQLKAEDRLKIFTFEEDATFQAVAEVDGRCKGGFFDDIVDTGCEDKAEILGIAQLCSAIYITARNVHIREPIR